MRRTLKRPNQIQTREGAQARSSSVIDSANSQPVTKEVLSAISQTSVVTAAVQNAEVNPIEQPVNSLQETQILSSQDAKAKVSQSPSPVVSANSNGSLNPAKDNRDSSSSDQSYFQDDEDEGVFDPKNRSDQPPHYNAAVKKRQKNKTNSVSLDSESSITDTTSTETRVRPPTRREKLVVIAKTLRDAARKGTVLARLAKYEVLDQSPHTNDVSGIDQDDNKKFDGDQNGYKSDVEEDQKNSSTNNNKDTSLAGTIILGCAEVDDFSDDERNDQVRYANTNRGIQSGKLTPVGPRIGIMSPQSNSPIKNRTISQSPSFALDFNARSVEIGEGSLKIPSNLSVTLTHDSNTATQTRTYSSTAVVREEHNLKSGLSRSASFSSTNGDAISKTNDQKANSSRVPPSMRSGTITPSNSGTAFLFIRNENGDLTPKNSAEGSGILPRYVKPNPSVSSDSSNTSHSNTPTVSDTISTSPTLNASPPLNESPELGPSPIPSTPNISSSRNSSRTQSSDGKSRNKKIKISNQTKISFHQLWEIPNEDQSNADISRDTNNDMKAARNVLKGLFYYLWDNEIDSNADSAGLRVGRLKGSKVKDPRDDHANQVVYTYDIIAKILNDLLKSIQDEKATSINWINLLNDIREAAITKMRLHSASLAQPLKFALINIISSLGLHSDNRDRMKVFEIWHQLESLPRNNDVNRILQNICEVLLKENADYSDVNWGKLYQAIKKSAILILNSQNNLPIQSKKIYFKIATDLCLESSSNDKPKEIREIALAILRKFELMEKDQFSKQIIKNTYEALNRELSDSNTAKWHMVLTTNARLGYERTRSCCKVRNDTYMHAQDFVDPKDAAREIVTPLWDDKKQDDKKENPDKNAESDKQEFDIRNQLKTLHQELLCDVLTDRKASLYGQEKKYKVFRGSEFTLPNNPLIKVRIPKGFKYILDLLDKGGKGRELSNLSKTIQDYLIKKLKKDYFLRDQNTKEKYLKIILQLNPPLQNKVETLSRNFLIDLLQKLEQNGIKKNEYSTQIINTIYDAINNATNDQNYWQSTLQKLQARIQSVLTPKDYCLFKKEKVDNKVKSILVTFQNSVAIRNLGLKLLQPDEKSKPACPFKTDEEKSCRGVLTHLLRTLNTELRNLDSKVTPNICYIKSLKTLISMVLKSPYDSVINWNHIEEIQKLIEKYVDKFPNSSIEKILSNAHLALTDISKQSQSSENERSLIFNRTQ